MTPTSIDHEAFNPKSLLASIGCRAFHSISPILGCAVNLTALATPTLATTFSPSGPAVAQCDGVCLGLIVVATLAICIGLLLSLALIYRRIRGRWISNYSHRRTNSSAVATGITSLNTRRSQTSGSYELSVIAPHPEDSPLPSCNITSTHDLPFVNFVTPDDQTSIVTVTNSSLESVSTSVTSLNSISTGELSIPPAPVISTIPLPPSDDEYDNLPQYSPIRYNYENHTIIQPWSAPVVVAQSNENEIGDRLNLNIEPTGSLGLILW